MVDERALTVPEVAQRLRVTAWTVREWLRAGRLRGYRPGGTKAGWRVDASDLAAFIEATKRSQEATTADGEPR
jgi:excisionase family DNA binding protein